MERAQRQEDGGAAIGTPAGMELGGATGQRELQEGGSARGGGISAERRQSRGGGISAGRRVRCPAGKGSWRGPGELTLMPTTVIRASERERANHHASLGLTALPPVHSRPPRAFPAAVMFGGRDLWRGMAAAVEGGKAEGAPRSGRSGERGRERAEVRKPHRLPYSVPPPARPRWRSGVLQGGWWRKEPTVGEGMEACGIRWRPEDDTARRDKGRWRGGSEASSPLISLSAALPLA